MGWKETDDDDEQYEITEADVREFENLRRQLQVRHLVSFDSTCIVVMIATRCLEKDNRLLLH